MEVNEISEDLKNRTKECKTPEEVLALAKEEGVTLSEDQLEQIAGGKGKWAHEKCEDSSGRVSPAKSKASVQEPNVIKLVVLGRPIRIT